MLLVEDEHDVRILLQQVLEDHGYVVMSAARPSDALRIAEHHVGPIHLLLTDMVMPEMSGRVLAERLSATRAEMMVLQMSGYTEYRSGPAEPSTAPSAFLQKPFTPDTVARGQSRAGLRRRAPPRGDTKLILVPDADGWCAPVCWAAREAFPAPGRD